MNVCTTYCRTIAILALSVTHSTIVHVVLSKLVVASASAVTTAATGIIAADTTAAAAATTAAAATAVTTTSWSSYDVLLSHALYL